MIGHPLRLVLELDVVAVSQCADRGWQAVVAQVLGLEAIQRITGNQQVRQDAGNLARGGADIGGVRVVSAGLLAGIVDGDHQAASLSAILVRSHASTSATT